MTKAENNQSKVNNLYSFTRLYSSDSSCIASDFSPSMRCLVRDLSECVRGRGTGPYLLLARAPRRHRPGAARRRLASRPAESDVAIRPCRARRRPRVDGLGADGAASAAAA